MHSLQVRHPPFPSRNLRLRAGSRRQVQRAIFQDRADGVIEWNLLEYSLVIWLLSEPLGSFVAPVKLRR